MHKLNTSSNYNFITALVARKIPSFSTASTATTASTTTVVLASMITAATLITANVGEGIYPLGLPKEDGKKKRLQVTILSKKHCLKSVKLVLNFFDCTLLQFSTSSVLRKVQLSENISETRNLLLVPYKTSLIKFSFSISNILFVCIKNTFSSARNVFCFFLSKSTFWILKYIGG